MNGAMNGPMKHKGERGLTLVELIVAFTIMAMLTAMAVPLARYKVRRDKERELVYALREVRKAIDDYKDASLAGKIEVKLGTDGYPESLDQLVQGVKLLQDATGYRWTLKSGQVTFQDGQPTGLLPGRLVRGAQARPG